MEMYGIIFPNALTKIETKSQTIYKTVNFLTLSGRITFISVAGLHKRLQRSSVWQIPALTMASIMLKWNQYFLVNQSAQNVRLLGIFGHSIFGHNGVDFLLPNKNLRILNLLLVHYPLHSLCFVTVTVLRQGLILNYVPLEVFVFYFFSAERAVRHKIKYSR